MLRLKREFNKTIISNTVNHFIKNIIFFSKIFYFVFKICLCKQKKKTITAFPLISAPRRLLNFETVRRGAY